MGVHDGRHTDRWNESPYMQLVTILNRCAPVDVDIDDLLSRVEADIRKDEWARVGNGEDAERYFKRVYPAGIMFDPEDEVVPAKIGWAALCPYCKGYPDYPSCTCEHKQLVACLNCGYFRTISVQSRRGAHLCMNCDQQMEVWEPRPQELGGLGG